MEEDADELRAQLEDSLHAARSTPGLDPRAPWREEARRALLRVQYWKSSEHGDLPAEVRRTADEPCASAQSITANSGTWASTKTG